VYHLLRLLRDARDREELARVVLDATEHDESNFGAVPRDSVEDVFFAQGVLTRARGKLNECTVDGEAVSFDLGCKSVLNKGQRRLWKR
jgi:hypothetical protein